MSEVTKPASKTAIQEPSNRDSLVPGVPADFIIEAIRRIDQELGKSEGGTRQAADVTPSGSNIAR